MGFLEREREFVWFVSFSWLVIVTATLIVVVMVIFFSKKKQNYNYYYCYLLSPGPREYPLVFISNLCRHKIWIPHVGPHVVVELPIMARGFCMIMFIVIVMAVVIVIVTPLLSNYY